LMRIRLKCRPNRTQIQWQERQFKEVARRFITTSLSIHFKKSGTGIGRGRESSVGITTGYGLDGLGIESRVGARLFAHVHTGPGAHPVSCTMGTGSRGADQPPVLMPRSKKSRAMSTPSGPSGLLRGTFTF
jgi:hypothetical protein